MSLAIVLASCNGMQQQSVHRIITKKVIFSSCTRSLCRAFMFLSFYHMRHREHVMFPILEMELFYFYLVYCTFLILFLPWTVSPFLQTHYIKWGSSGHSVDTQWTLSGHSADTQQTHSGHSANTQCILNKYLVKTKRILSGHSADTQRTPIGHLLDTQWTLSRHSNIHKPMSNE